jgi:uncharacterized protein
LSIYFDTSALVALFTKEATAFRIIALMDRGFTSRPLISDWNVTEFAAAISFKLNLGTITLDERFEILDDFHNASNETFEVIPVTSEDFTRAAAFANQSGLRLRGGDALHLGIAAGRNLRILTLDKRMIDAANTLGIGVQTLD